MEDLAPRQQQVLKYISEFIQEHGYPPSFREIARAMDVRSTNAVADHIRALQRKGYIERLESGRNRARAIRLTSKSTGDLENDTTCAVPVIGRVAAGTPILAEENREGTLHVDRSLLPIGGPPLFALRVAGSSMIEDGILDGDFVFVRQKETASTGDTVVAMVDGDATVKRFYRDGGRVRLQPANSAMEPIFVDSTQHLKLLGQVVGVYRRMR